MRFQSTHPCRVRRNCGEIRLLLRSFNPRTHVGCDMVIPLVRAAETGFNPRTHVGCDPSPFAFISRYMRFQSTHPCRVRQDFERYFLFYAGFNPRTHVGCDCMSQRNQYLPVRFNPRTHVGCDPVRRRGTSGAGCFNPRTHVGCDQRCLSMQSLRIMFQSTHPCRVRHQFSFHRERLQHVSIHAPM